jgi:23S rRNA (pseudouridine1915-N3)-methyltransferase
MRLHLCAVGRLRSGPERDLVDDYLHRLDRVGRPLGLGPVAEHEVEDRRGGGMAAAASPFQALNSHWHWPGGATAGGRMRPS